MLHKFIRISPLAEPKDRWPQSIGKWNANCRFLDLSGKTGNLLQPPRRQATEKCPANGLSIMGKVKASGNHGNVSLEHL